MAAKFDQWLTKEGLLRIQGWARDGLTDKDISKNMMIGVSTLREWKGRFEEIRAILDRAALGARMGVCLDTCHVWDAGYDIAGDLDGVLREFDRVVGLDRLRAIHLNDSRNPLGARKDRHARIGEGCIGLEALVRVVNHPLLRDLPFYLETPQDELSGWAKEIALLRSRRR